MFRKLLFWSHFTVGAVAGVFIFLMSATGLVLTYEAQITEWAIARSVQAPPQGVVLDADQLLAAQGPVTAGQSLVIYWDDTTPPRLSAGRSSTRLDPYTGAALTEAGSGVDAFFGAVTSLHRWLTLSGANETGGAVVAAANLGFLFLVASGIYLWLPPVLRWSLVRMRLVFRSGLPTAQARHHNWHHVLGAWALIPLFGVVLSGVVISYPWASSLVYTAVGEEAPTRRGPPSGSTVPAAFAAQTLGDTPALAAADLIAIGVALTPNWTSASLTLTAPDAAYTTLTVDRGNGRQAALRDTLVIDRATGDVVSTSGVETQSLGSRLRGWFRFAHTGEVYGIVGQTLAGLSCIAAMVLVYTGFSLGLRRVARMRRKARLA